VVKLKGVGESFFTRIISHACVQNFSRVVQGEHFKIKGLMKVM